MKTRPTSGKVGSTVTILGTHIGHATSVKFNGVAAAFRIASSSEIKAIVPVGATTGTVEVTVPELTTPNITLLSNLAFRVAR